MVDTSSDAPVHITRVHTEMEDGAYGVGEDILVTVVFSAPVREIRNIVLLFAYSLTQGRRVYTAVYYHLVMIVLVVVVRVAVVFLSISVATKYLHVSHE